ncbi:hypothetical protein ACQYWQ_01340 [Streptomyces sp. P6-2-1]|uniref:hypothetical protein n=1 Tax=Streptomyces sp. P6-2-1 TaxID=3422591 RepID=UPI003D36C4BD
MTSGRRAATVFLTVIGGLVLALVAVCRGWPLWVWPVLGVLVLATPPVLFARAARRRGEVPAAFDEQRTASPVEHTERRINEVALPSAWPDYDFLLSGTVRWWPLAPPGSNEVIGNPGGLAVEAVLARARAITELRDPGRVSFVRHEVSGALSAMRADRSGHVRAMAEDIRLVLRAQDQERLEKLADLRKRKAVWEHERTHEQSRRAYLGDDVLKDTGSAVVWWLAKNDGRIDKTVADLDLLARLTSAANDTEIPERLRALLAPPPGEEQEEEVSAAVEASVADHLAGVFAALGVPDGDPRRAMLAKQFAEYLRGQDFPESADRLVRRFDPPAEYRAGETEAPDPAGG